VTSARLTPAQPAATLELAERTLRDHGLRLSTARRVVLEALFAADGPVSAEDIASGLSGRLTRSDLASVYRNLETLEEVGLVNHVHLGHGPGLYALAAEGEREYVMCERCGAFQAVLPEVLDGVRDALRAAVGHEARFTHFPIVGLCADCAVPAEPVHVQHSAATEHAHVRS
jgi:Fur family ferric uptake transcriptional regulator